MGIASKMLIEESVIKEEMSLLGVTDLTKATIRELVRLANNLEKRTGVEFIHMEMGVPGLEPSRIGAEAEIAALNAGVARKYPPVEGIPQLKEEMARFVKNFIGVDVAPEGCLPCVGSMQGGMASFLLVNRLKRGRDRVLFIDPGFPVQKSQLKLLGMAWDTFDAYAYRGKKLGEKIESYLKAGRTSAILYSNPNNPSWICLTEDELKELARLSEAYDVPLIEDLAYFAMDFRKDLSHPGKAPYQASVAKYTANWIMLISSSKAFSYAGQRIGCIVVSDKLFSREYPDLLGCFPSAQLGRALIYGAMYGLSSGVAGSVQHGFAALLQAANEGRYNFVGDVREYGRRAKIMKDLFLKHGFELVYDADGELPLADGFYFTVRYPELDGNGLLHYLLCFGISAISLGSTGSEHSEGLRACVSQITESQLSALGGRLEQFDTIVGGILKLKR
ncbi:MAG: pyridoxal phosphate-dependent aminotransferase [Bacteroides sp.]